MKYKGRMSTLSVICICLAVSALFGIAYAAFTKNITLSGGASVSESKWEVIFDEITDYTCTNCTFVTAPYIESNKVEITTAIDYEANNMNAGNATVEAYIANNGTFDAELSQIVQKTPTCTSYKNSTLQAQNACSNISYYLKYFDESSQTSKNLTVGQIIPAGTRLKIIVTIKYGGFETAMMQSDVKISNLGLSLDFVQA